jgi:hypothetical protein
MQTRSKIFAGKVQSDIEMAVISLVNSEKDLMSARTLNSPRAVGDAIQEVLESKFDSLLPKAILKEYNSSFARRSMADFAFTDNDGFYYVVDNKTHNLDTAFNMPNLTSVERLSRFYEDDSNYFTLLTVAYRVEGVGLNVKACHFVPIEHLDWSCLTVGALGWGQIQIANSNNIRINQKQTRKAWMIRLCDILAEFYPKEIEKISGRIKHFEKIRQHWEEHPDF